MNYFDPVLENEIKDNANVIQLSQTDEPLTLLTMHPQLEKHSRNSHWIKPPKYEVNAKNCLKVAPYTCYAVTHFCALRSIISSFCKI